MKKRLPLIPILILVLLLPGCFVQSFQPFHTKSSIVDLPAIYGDWRLVRKSEENVAQEYPEPWVFGVDEITTFEDGISSPLDAVYFKVDNVTFVDLSPSETEGQPNAWWAIHTIPVHSVCKIEISGDTLNVIPLDGDWVEGMFDEKKLALSYIDIDSEDGHIVLTSDAEELELFLKKYGRDTEAFEREGMLTFKRVK